MKTAMLKRLEALNTVNEEAQLLRELDAALAALREEARRRTQIGGSEAKKNEKTS